MSSDAGTERARVDRLARRSRDARGARRRRREVLRAEGSREGRGARSPGATLPIALATTLLYRGLSVWLPMLPGAFVPRHLTPQDVNEHVTELLAPLGVTVVKEGSDRDGWHHSAIDVIVAGGEIPVTLGG